MSKLHAKLSASGSERWINCPGSVEAESKIPNKSSPYADEGTLAHELGDICNKEDVDTIKHLDTTITAHGGRLKTVVDKSMVNYIQDYLDYVRSFRSSDYDFYTEETVEFSHVVPDGFGTMDCGLMDHTTSTLHIFDLKYGYKIVSAYKNTQGILYASGFYNELNFLFDIEKIVIHIVQPRCHNYSKWEITIDELKEFEKFLSIKANEALMPNAPIIAGAKQCQWCNAAAYLIDDQDNFCEELLKMVEDFKTKMINEEYEDMSKLPGLLDDAKTIEGFIKKVKEIAMEKARQGYKIEGYKLIQKGGKSKWRDGVEVELKELLGEDCYAPTKPLLGITEMKRVIKDKGIAKGKKITEIITPLTEKPEGKLEVVRVEDPGKEVMLVEDIFDEV